MDCRVVVEAAVPVYDVGTADEAVRIAISKTGEMLNPELNYVEINMGSRTSPSGDELLPAFIAADEALVALELEMTVFNVEREEHASRIARKEIGQRLESIPLKVLSVEPIPSDDAETNDTDDSAAPSEGDETDESGSQRESSSDSADSTNSTDGGETSDDDLIPEFEDLVDES